MNCEVARRTSIASDVYQTSETVEVLPHNGSSTIRNNGDGSFRHSPLLASAAVMTLSQRTDALVRGLDLVLEHHSAPNSIRDALANQLHAHLDSSIDETVWLKRSKYALTYPLSKYLRNEPPPPPDVKFLASGLLRAWMKPRLSCFNRKNTHLWYSWLQAKRSTLPASDDIVDATYEKHFATLTKVDKGDEATMDSIFSDQTFLSILHKIRSDMMNRLDGSSPFEQKSPSGSACFEQTRSKGGQQGELMLKVGLDGDSHASELWSMRCDPVVYGRKTSYNVVSEVRCAYGFNEWNNLPSIARALDLSKPTKCTIQAVLEPMKVRVISKGEALPYYTCRPLQKALHSSMRDLDCFRLIGRPFSPTDMLDLKVMAKTTDQWFSVDYSAATDGLSWKYSGRIFRFLIAELPKDQQDLALAVLGPHALHYPVKGGRDVIFKGVQTNGQLMGSILSFPMLCLANLGVYLDVTRDSHQGWSDQQRLSHVLVNGDDMVYAADPSLWKRHVDIAGKVGLEMSVGKAYQHREYANVNSTSVHLNLEKTDSTPWQINYLNAGLFYGQHKIQGRVDADDEWDRSESYTNSWASSRICSDLHLNYLLGQAHLGQNPNSGLATNLNVLLEGTLPGRQKALLMKFLLFHKEDLRKECTAVIRYRGKTSLVTRNLFLPLSVGGMGVIPPSIGVMSTQKWRNQIKPSQLQIANYFLEKNSAPVTSSLPLPGYELNKLETEFSAPWVRNIRELSLFSARCTMKKCSKSLARRGFVRYGLHPQALSI